MKLYVRASYGSKSDRRGGCFYKGNKERPSFLLNQAIFGSNTYVGDSGIRPLKVKREVL